jgi:oligopeptide/dipeptide ABC transporter ATP-binding protein
MEPLLQVRGLTVSYGGRKSSFHALNDVSFEIAPGEAVGVLGESGSGKSTLALALLGLLPGTASLQKGDITFRGTNLLRLSGREWRKVRGAAISLVHQEPALALNPVMRVGDQVAEVLRAHQSLSAVQVRAKVGELLSQAGLAAEACIGEAYPHQLSGGQRQRVAIAQAIACEPALIIADEPTTALDAAVRMEIIELLRSLQRRLNAALMLITHEPAVLRPIAGRILVMYAGRIVEDGPAELVLDAPLHPFTQALLNCEWPASPAGFQPGRFEGIPRESDGLRPQSIGCAFAPRCPYRMDRCEFKPPAETRVETSRRVWCFKYE